MGHLRKASLATAASLLAMLMLAGCGDGDDDDSSNETDEETTSETTETTEATDASTSASTETASPTAPTEPMDPSGDITQEQVDAALLTAEELGAGFTEGTWTDTSTAPPCDPNGTPTDQQVPPQITGGVNFENADSTAFMEEELSIYETPELAAEAFQLGSAGLDCAEGTAADGSALTISEPTDVTADVNTSGLGNSTLWEVQGEGYEGVLVVTLSSRVLLVNFFASTPEADTSALPNPLEVAEAAFDKALAN